MIREFLARLTGSDRWGVCTGIDIGTRTDPYLGRLRLIETPWFAVFIHHIHRSDADPDPHDHPWSVFWSWVICGSYKERVWPDKHNPDRWYQRNRGHWSLAALRRGSAHIITETSKPLWTLVVTGRSYGSESWGFWIKDGPAHARGEQWRVYGSANGAAEYAAAKDAEDGPAGKTGRQRLAETGL